MNLKLAFAFLSVIVPTSGRNLRADNMPKSPHSDEMNLQDDTTPSIQAEGLPRRLNLNYQRVGDCITGTLSGGEAKAACEETGLGCCTGLNSCSWLSREVKICKDSCTGELSCAQGPSSVGQGSCNSYGACRNIYEGTVGANSCNSYESCRGATEVGDCVDTCGRGQSCAVTQVYNLDTNQCQDYSIDETSCIVGTLTGAQTTTACADWDLNCCSGIASCTWDSPEEVKMCESSCTGTYSCKDSWNVGPRSCTASSACYERNGESVGADSCTAGSACRWMTGPVGNNSCQGFQACYKTAYVGHGSCIDDQSCNSADTVGDCVEGCSYFESCESSPEIYLEETDQCVTSPTASPTAGPSTSPTQTPSYSPTASPSASPSMSPTLSYIRDENNCIIGTLSGAETTIQFYNPLSNQCETKKHSVDEDNCIVGEFLTGAETTAACAAEDLNCCIGELACNWEPREVKVCQNSCRGLESCHWASISASSFHSYDGSTAVRVGSNSCSAESACENTIGPIGENSCQDWRACYRNDGPIGSNSCTAFRSCYGGARVGNSSCTEFESCIYFYYPGGVVGNGSCKEFQSCQHAASVGNCVDRCGEYETCADGPKSYDEEMDLCSSASPTQAPSSSPSKSPTTSPSSRPSSSPSKVPTASPSMSPSHKPTESPTPCIAQGFGIPGGCPEGVSPMCCSGTCFTNGSKAGQCK